MPLDERVRAVPDDEPEDLVAKNLSGAAFCELALSSERDDAESGTWDTLSTDLGSIGRPPPDAGSDAEVSVRCGDEDSPWTSDEDAIEFR